MRNVLFGLLAGLALAMMITVGATNARPAADRPTTIPSEAIQKPNFSALNAAKQMSEAFVEVSKRVTPSIVMIVNQEKLQNAFGDDALRQFSPDDFFRDFFDFNPRQREQVQKTLGSGVILSSDGYIITNNHVVDNSTKLQVTLPDGRRMPAKVIGKDPKTDLALIRVETNNLKPLPFGNYADIQVGEWVLAVGSPFGEALQRTVTAGIISAKGRSNVGIADYEDFLQTDAAINPGNSGGALVDLDGKLIGINTAIISSNGANAGIGFAIPVNIVQNIVTQLKVKGRVIRGYIGVTIQDISPEMKNTIKLGNRDGAVISDVQGNSPAARAGLKTYDVIVSLNGKPVHDNTELRNGIASLKPGTRASLGILRNGDEKTMEVTVGELSAEQQTAGGNEGREEKLGMELQNLTPFLARQLRTKQDHGVVVTRVSPGSVAEDSGLQQGDVIFEVNREEVRSVREFQNKIQDQSSTLLAVDREGNSFFVTLEIR